MSKPKSNVPPSSDPNRFFKTDHLEADLKGRSIRSGMATIGAQALKFVLNLGSGIILARLLAPEDFGLIAMVATVTSFLELFKDLGLSMATVQKAEINHAQVSTLFWISVAFSGLVTLLTAAFGPLIAWFYKEPRLIPITLVLATGFIFTGLSAQQEALLKRQMRFSALATIDIIASVVAIVTGILLAWNGFGYWALVYMRLTMVIVNSIGDWIICGWRPGWPVWGSGVVSMLAFGSNITGFNLLNYFVRTFDNVLIGWYWGAEQLGLYAKAYQLLLMPIQQINGPITSVAIPTLSRLQSNPDRYREYYRKGILLLATLGMPLVVFMFVAADKLVLALLGPKWTEAIVLFQILAPAAFVGTFNVATGWVYTTLGRTDRQLRWSVLMSTVTAICFLLTIQWGTIGIAASVSLSLCLLRYPGIIYCFQSTPIKVSDLLGVLWKPAVASLLAGATLFAVEKVLPWRDLLALGLLTDLVIYTLFYLFFWCLLPNGKKTLSQIITLAKELRRKPN